MSGYTRQSATEIIATNVVKATPLNVEFNKLRDAFDFDSSGVTGHKHDGSSDEGSYVPLIADLDGLNKVSVDTSNNRVGVFVEVSSSAVEQVRFQDGAIVPVVDNDIDLGATGAEFKDLYVTGTAYIDSIEGSLSGAISGTFTGDVTGDVTGNLTGNVTGNVTGDLTGNVTGNVTGDLTGNVSGVLTGGVVGNVTGNLTGDVTGNISSSGTSTFSGAINVPTPTSDTNAATKAYVDSQLDIVVSDFAITESGTDLNFSYSGSNVATLTSAGNFSITSITLGGSDIQTLIDDAKPSFEATASGALSDGSMVVINADGTVSVSPTIPSAVFESATSEDISATYDTANNKVVIAYKDTGNSSYGTAVVGTVTGTSISFGTPVVFASAYTQGISTCFDTTNGKVVISYSDATNNGYAIVGTVSGTSISFGTAVNFDIGLSSTNITYDSGNSKVVVFYSTGGTSYGIVGTVSGTSISFGTAGVYAATTSGEIRSVYDTTNAKIVTTYVQTSNNDGYAVVGTVSGTSISFGTPVRFQEGTLTGSDALSIAYDSANSKPVIFYYEDGGGATYGIVGTVSGTSISFGTAVEFNDNTRYITSSYNPQSGKIVVSYRDSGNSSYGTIIEGTVSGTSISFESELVIESGISSYFSSVYDPDNESVIIAYLFSGQGKALSYPKLLTTENNFVGISSGAYTDGQTAKIQIVGSVDDAQSSLTAGNKYYLQTDGTLDTVADIPEVYVGLAIASDKIIVKG